MLLPGDLKNRFHGWICVWVRIILHRMRRKYPEVKGEEWYNAPPWRVPCLFIVSPFILLTNPLDFACYAFFFSCGLTNGLIRLLQKMFMLRYVWLTVSIRFCCWFLLYLGLALLLRMDSLLYFSLSFGFALIAWEWDCIIFGTTGNWDFRVFVRFCIKVAD